MKTKKELIDAMVADEKQPFVEADRTALEALTEAQLTTLSEQNHEARVKALVAGTIGPKEVTKEVIKEVKVAAEAPKTVEEALAGMLPEVASVIRGAMASANAMKTATIKALKDSGRCDLTDAELGGKSQDELDKLVKLAGVAAPKAAVDYSAQGAARETSEKQEIPAAPSVTEAIKAARAAKK